MDTVREIVKIQVSLTEPRIILVYNEDRSYVHQTEAIPELAQLPGFKGYFYVYRNDEELILDDVAPEQEW